MCVCVCVCVHVGASVCLSVCCHRDGTLFTFQERPHVQLLWKTDKGVELLLMACLPEADIMV